ncbi:MAG: Ty1/Copia family ribonuclease HI, partial [Gloeomargaritales cyanobacterium]
TGVLHLLNQTPIDWFSKRQNTVETATYGSEFIAARQATDQIVDLRYTMRRLGVPLDGPAWMFGDNQSVVTNSTIPHSTLNKRHNALSYHRVREAIAAKVMHFVHLDGKQNPADCMTKFLTHAVAWPLLEPFLFWRGETTEKKMKTGVSPPLVEGSDKSPLRVVSDVGVPNEGRVISNAPVPSEGRVPSGDSATRE